jgi:hypothetical protein
VAAPGNPGLLQDVVGQYPVFSGVILQKNTDLFIGIFKQPETLSGKELSYENENYFATTYGCIGRECH